MNKEITEINKKAIESALMDGDLSKLSPDEKLAHYQSVCETIGLNPLTQPFQYITLNGKLKMYALKGATDQLRKIYQIDCLLSKTEYTEDIYIVTCKVTDSKGRTDEDMGFAKVAGLKGDMLGNAILKAVTKSKRRATLSMCGLGMLDEDEIKTIKEDTGSGWGKKEPKDINAKLEEQVKELQSKTGGAAKVAKVVETLDVPEMQEITHKDKIQDAEDDMHEALTDIEELGIKSEECKHAAIKSLQKILGKSMQDDPPEKLREWAGGHLSEFTDMCDYYTDQIVTWQKEMNEMDFQEVKDFCVEVKGYFVPHIQKEAI
jgi:hypothetical protein